MTVQIALIGKLYVVQAIFEPGGRTWETVDSTQWQGKAMRLRDHLRRNSYKSVREVYKSEYYMQWVMERY